MNKAFNHTGNFLKQNLEAFVWITAMLYFGLSPIHSESHFTICPLSLAGFEYCPVCGLGRSMILLLHGNVSESFAMHPLALFAFFVLVYRIIIVFQNYYQREKQNTLLNTPDSCTKLIRKCNKNSVQNF